MKKVLLYEAIGIVFIIVVGSMLHFTFEASGKNLFVALFSAVNESVWEHLKLGFWPALLFALIEYKYIYRKSDNFFFAKVVGIYLIPISTVILFYSYTAFIEDNFVADIIIFIVSIMIGRITSYKLLASGKITERFEKISLVALIALAIALMLFTFYPPHLPIFMDPSGSYGIRI